MKKPHNKEGVIAERSRINFRFKNKHFRRFANYEDGIVEPVFGAFYATAAYADLQFNYFREDEDYPVKQKLEPVSDQEENAILKDNNLLVIKHSPEFKTNKEAFRPTNRMLTYLFSRERFAFVLRYTIAYVEEETGLQKHIMRYPQIFATMAIAAQRLPWIARLIASYSYSRRIFSTMSFHGTRVRTRLLPGNMGFIGRIPSTPM